MTTEVDAEEPAEDYPTKFWEVDINQVDFLKTLGSGAAAR